uniref:ZP domain-containing protein n=1 Tax=Plectus sambesii TaxID=2011161 RepID=A0A914WCS6_9BILA
MDDQFFRLIAVIVSILLSCTIPTEAQGDVAISSLVCKLDGMEITLNEDYMTVTFPTWKDYGLGLFVDDALPSCGQMAPLTFLGLELGPYTGFLNFSTCNINITKNHVGQELVNYTAVVNGRFNALNNYITSPTANFHYPNMTVTLYCVWNAEQFANASIGIVPTPQPTYYGSTTDTNQVVMNTTVDSEVFEGEKIRVGIILTHIDAFTFVAELPMECTISNADNSADAKLYTVYESCPFWNISQFNPSLNFDAYKKNSSDFYFEFDAFTYYEGQPSTLLIQCKVQMCLYAVDCPSVMTYLTN